MIIHANLTHTITARTTPILSLHVLLASKKGIPIEREKTVQIQPKMRCHRFNAGLAAVATASLHPFIYF
jgi:hypothetical protein